MKHRSEIDNDNFWYEATESFDTEKERTERQTFLTKYFKDKGYSVEFSLTLPFTTEFYPLTYKIT